LIRIISFTDLLLAASSRCVRSLERCRLLPNHLLQARTQYDYTLHDRSPRRRRRPRRPRLRPMPFVAPSPNARDYFIARMLTTFYI
jgi:hypothetical protein